MIYAAMQNAITETANKNNNLEESSFIEDGLKFCYESQIEFNKLTDVLHKREINSLMETGQIQPLNEAEKEEFFTKVKNVLKRFWEWIVKLFKRFIAWLKGLFSKKGSKEVSEENIKRGATAYIEAVKSNSDTINFEAPTVSSNKALATSEPKGSQALSVSNLRTNEPPTTKSDKTPAKNKDVPSERNLPATSKIQKQEGYIYANQIDFIKGVNKAEDIGKEIMSTKDNSTFENNSFDLAHMILQMAPNSRVENLNAPTNETVTSSTEYFRTYCKGNKLDNVFLPLAEEYQKGSYGYLETEVKRREKDANDILKNFEAYKDTMNKVNGSSLTDNSQVSCLVKAINMITNIFSSAYSVQLECNKQFLTQLNSSAKYFASIGLKVTRGIKESTINENETEEIFNSNESIEENASYSNTFLDNLAII